MTHTYHKETGLTGPLPAAIPALQSIFGMSLVVWWFLPNTGSQSDHSNNVVFPHFSLRALFVFVGCIAIVCFIGVMFEWSTREYRLLEAAYSGDLSTVRHLLGRGTDVHVRDGRSGTSLMYAAGNGHLEIVKLLLKQGVPVNERSRMNRTPLMWAARSGNQVVAKFLVEQDADMTLTDIDGHTAIDLARRNGRSEMVSYLTTKLPQSDRQP